MAKKRKATKPLKWATYKKRALVKRAARTDKTTALPPPTERWMIHLDAEGKYFGPFDSRLAACEWAIEKGDTRWSIDSVFHQSTK